MLTLALKSSLPLIRVSTTDTVNVEEVLRDVLKGTSSKIKQVSTDDIPRLAKSTFMASYSYFFIVEEEVPNPTTLYNALSDCNRTLILVNCEDIPLAYNAGELRTPKRLLAEYISEFLEPDDASVVCDALAGLTMKEAAEICRMAMTEFKELSVKSVTAIKNSYAKLSRGIYQVDTEYDLYVPPSEMSELETDIKLFLRDDIPEKLRARGYLLFGPAGTGKTMGSKFIARELGIPLYRLDLGAMLNKYVGESENNLANALSLIDSLSPCVLLIDEIEKIFSGGDDSGVSKRMLSGLLWWMQEHSTKVLTLMTSNDTSVLPKELYRPGRIDRTIELLGLSKEEAMPYMELVYKTVCKKGAKFPKAVVSSLLSEVEYPLAQAVATELMYEEVKKQYLTE